LFFNLVIVTAFTRVGLAITNSGQVTASSFLYFAVFWTIWSKEASYSTRFDTTDLSAKAGQLVTCFAVLFASLSVSTPMDQPGGSTRIMMMATSIAVLHFLLMARVFWWHRGAEPNTLDHHVQKYALYRICMNLLEATTWMVGIFVVPLSLRWIIFTVGVLFALRIPRAFLANDFHGT
jgi:low temperature requirement protein LtrA